MRKFGWLTFVVSFVAVVSVSGASSEPPAWAYPLNPPVKPSTVDPAQLFQVPDSPLRMTRKEISTITIQAPDWHPDEHPPMPEIVVHGRPQVFACAYCHLPNGAGRPENASLAGLPVNYFKQQVAALRTGDRRSSTPDHSPQFNMTALAKAATEEEVGIAAHYFASLKPASFVRVIETDTVPKTIVAGWILTPAPGGSTESLGHRIVETADDFERFENRDSRTTFVAYVPPGSIQRGAELAATGGNGRTLACAVCHGPELRGLLDVPRLAGRSPTYLVRQLYDFQHGVRKGGAAELMKPVVAALTEDDMIALAAYIANLSP